MAASEALGERVTRLEVRLDNIENKVDGLAKKVDELPRWIIGTGLVCLGIGLAVIFGVVHFQAGWVQENINAHQKTSEARMEEFRRDSDRNYDLALKALERSMVQPVAPVAQE